MDLNGNSKHHPNKKMAQKSAVQTIETECFQIPQDQCSPQTRVPDIEFLPVRSK